MQVTSGRRKVWRQVDIVWRYTASYVMNSSMVVVASYIKNSSMVMQVGKEYCKLQETGGRSEEESYTERNWPIK